MTKRFYLIIVLFIIAAIAFSIPFIFKMKDETINQTLNLSATLISAIATIMTFIIALLLFNKYGLESPFIEKSSSKVFELLEKVKETTFAISSPRGYFQVQMSDPFKYSEYIEKFYKEKLVFSDNYLNDLNSLFNLSNSPFMPPEISKKIDNLRFHVLTYDINESNIENYSKVQIVGAERIQNIKFTRFNGEDLTAFEFFKILDEVSNEIKQWIQSNSTIPIELNL